MHAQVMTSGTARGVFAPVKAAGITTGGKTGTAQKVVPVYDPKTGQPKTRHRIERDNRGNIIREYDEVIMDEENPRIDGWFLCIAPLEKPQLAIAVIVEGGGSGAQRAARETLAALRAMGELDPLPETSHIGRVQIEEGGEERIVSRPMMYVALSYDHRIVDGEQAVTFLVRIKERLEDPGRLLLDS